MHAFLANHCNQKFFSEQFYACMASLFVKTCLCNRRYMKLHTRGPYSKSSKTNSKKYSIYEIYKIIFLHSLHPIHNTSVSDVSIEKFRPGIY